MLTTLVACKVGCRTRATNGTSMNFKVLNFAEVHIAVTKWLWLHSFGIDSPLLPTWSAFLNSVQFPHSLKALRMFAGEACEFWTSVLILKRVPNWEFLLKSFDTIKKEPFDVVYLIVVRFCKRAWCDYRYLRCLGTPLHLKNKLGKGYQITVTFAEISGASGAPTDVLKERRSAFTALVQREAHQLGQSRASSSMSSSVCSSWRATTRRISRYPMVY